MILADKIPLIYHSILEEILTISFPQEKIANCTSCNLCQTEKSPYLDIKCCNYFPFMTNFLLGGILSDTEETSLIEGKRIVRELIKSKKGVTPYGILPHNSYSSTQKEIFKKENIFGTKEEMEQQKCPYLFDGNCSVWKYREHLCVSFFCLSVGGKNGNHFWEKVDDLLNLVEQKLSKFVLLKLNWNVETILSAKINQKCFEIENEDGSINEENYKSLWGEWFGREEEFFIEAYKCIQDIDKKAINEIIGIEFEILKKAIKSSSLTFEKNVYPEILVLQGNLIRELIGDKIQLISGEKSVEIDVISYSFIKLFDGTNNTVDVFQKAFTVLFSLNKSVDDLIEIGFLKKLKDQ